MIKLLSPQDFTRLEDSLPTLTLKEQAIMAILMYCGLRVGELTLLRIKDLDIDDPRERELHVRAQTTKTGAGRFMPLPHLAIPILQNYLRQSHSPSAPPLPQSFLFPGSAGRPHMSVHGIEQLVSRISAKILNKRVTPHTLRHTYATMLLKYSNIREVQLLLGHKKLSSTQIYTHPNRHDLARSVKKTFS